MTQEAISVEAELNEVRMAHKKLMRAFREMGHNIAHPWPGGVLQAFQELSNEMYDYEKSLVEQLNAPAQLELFPTKEPRT